MPSRVLETVLTGRNLLSPALTTAARDVESFDAKVTAASTRASASADASSKAQVTAADRVVAANTRSAESASVMSAKIAASQTKAAESSRALADVSESSAARSAAAWSSLATKGLPIAAAAVAVVTGKMAADFQSDVTRLQTTAGELPQNMAVVSKGLLTMAGQVGVSADTLAKGMYTVESAGYHGQQALVVEKAAAQAAAQEHADLTKTTDALTTALHDYNLPASDAAKVTSEMVTAVSHGKTTMEDFTGSLHSVTPLAAALHVPLADILGDLAAMTASGESADQATQNMADTLRHLQAPTSTMTSELAQLGITSSNLVDDLSTKGLSGTIQEVSQAILTKMGPSGKVLLDALNKSKVATADLAQMVATMPPSLAKLSQGLESGSVTFSDYRKAVQDMGGPASAMGKQFLSLYESSQGFNQALKSGSPDAQAYSAALQKAMGDSAGLTVALQLTGDHATAVNASIKDIAASSGDASGNIKGWNEVQGNLNQKMAEAGAEAKSMAIEIGQHVLPAATATFGWIASTGLPAVEHLGSAVGTTVHEFMGLPAPIRDTAAALVVLKLADQIGLVDRLTSGVGGVRTAFANARQELASSGISLRGFGDEMRLQQSLWESEMKDAQLATGGLGDWQRAMGATEKASGSMSAELTTAQKIMRDWDTTLTGTGVAAVQAGGGLSKMGDGLDVLAARASGIASGAMSALKTAGSGVVNMLGGPWGVGMLGATAAITGLQSAIQHARQTEEGWTEDLKQGGQAAQQAEAQMDHWSSVQNTLNSGFLGFAKNMSSLGSAAMDTVPKAKTAQQAYQDWYQSLGLVDQKQEDVTQATANLSAVLKTHSENSLAAKEAENQLQIANQQLTTAQQDLANATTTTTQKIQAQANATLALTDSGLASKQSYDEFSSALGQYRDDVAAGTMSTQQLTVEQDALIGAADSARDSAGQAGAAWAKSSGFQDAASASSYAQLLMLEKVANAMGVDTPASVLTQINALKQSAAQGHLTAAQMDAIAQSIDAIPVDPHIQVTADTQTAQNQIDGFLKQYQNIQYTGTAIVVNGRVVAKADGGPIVGPGTGTSDTAGLYALSNGEHVWTAAEVDAAGGHSGVTALRKAVLSAGHGLAAGGPVGWNIGERFPVQPSQAMLDSAKALAGSFSPAGGFVGGGMWRSLGQQVAAQMGYGSQFPSIDFVFTHESGWNNLAQNPTSTAFGIPQFLAATWAAYGGKTTDPGTQIRDGIEYMRDRYGSPNAAAAFWAAHHWYADGTNYVPSDQLAVLHKGEAVVPAAVNQGAPYQAAPAMPGYGSPFSGASFGPTGPVSVQVQARVFVGDREITDIARVEAEAVVVGALKIATDRGDYNG